MPSSTENAAQQSSSGTEIPQPLDASAKKIPFETPPAKSSQPIAKEQSSSMIRKSGPGTPRRRKRQQKHLNDENESALRSSRAVQRISTTRADTQTRNAATGTPFRWIEALQRILGAISTPFVIPLTAAACLLVFLLAVHYWVSHIYSSVSLMPFLPGFSLPIHGATSLYCGSIGWGCSGRQQRQARTDVARLARSVSEQATQAHDIFQSISALGNPKMVPGLHFVELWELSIAVSASSNLPSRDELGESLKELGDLTRDMSDRLVGINAQGVNSFSWTVREFKRIQKTIQRIHERQAQYTTDDVSRQLEDLFVRLTKNLDYLLANIQDTLPLASRASHLGGEVLVDLNTERLRLLETKEQTPLWRALLEAHSFKGKQLQRDLDLAEDSIGNLKAARTQLEETRKFLLRYRENVAYFKAGLVGFHLSEHQLAPEHEVEALAEVVSDFARAVDEAKQIGSSSGRKRGQEAEQVAELD